MVPESPEWPREAPCAVIIITKEVRTRNQRDLLSRPGCQCETWAMMPGIITCTSLSAAPSNIGPGTASYCIKVQWLWSLSASHWSVSGSLASDWLVISSQAIIRELTSSYLRLWRKLHPSSCYYNTKLFANRHTVNFIIISGSQGNSFRGGQAGPLAQSGLRMVKMFHHRLWMGQLSSVRQCDSNGPCLLVISDI